VSKFRTKLIQGNKLYIPKCLRKQGFNKEIEIRPNAVAAAIYPSGTPLGTVIKSLRIILQDLELSLELEQMVEAERSQ
jgi:hypothetical protein